jgi:Outer membrane protein beta-barrel domain
MSGGSIEGCMRVFILLLLGAASAWPQMFSAGVKAGVPFTDFLDSTSSGRAFFNPTTNRYLVGPTAELRLPAGFGLEIDALYRHFSYTGANTAVDVVTNLRTSGNSWEFPILLKYRFPMPLVRPFVDGGVAFNTLSGLKQTIVTTVLPDRSTSITNNNTMGVVLGAGLDIHAILLHVSPEIRFTRWTNQQFLSANGLLHSNLNQAEFLVGFTF